MPNNSRTDSDVYVQLENVDGTSSVVLVCEHASCIFPPEFEFLGLPPDQRQSHVAWDPGAMAVALYMGKLLDAGLVAGTFSRLIYDCNRPPEAIDAMPAKSEIFDIPGNVGLTDRQRADRTETYYEPFRLALSQQISRTRAPIIVTIHSFTPTYYGKSRDVEIGVLHDTDTRLADAMLNTATNHTQANVQRNQPYGADDGVTHTLKEHAIAHGHMNVMLEIRNDLIQTASTQQAMAQMLAHWVVDAVAQTHAKGDVKCAE